MPQKSLNPTQNNRKIRPKNSKKYRLSEISQALSSTQKIPRKNPKIAGLLSLIPGGGFLYCGRYKDALTAFFI